MKQNNKNSIKIAALIFDDYTKKDDILDTLNIQEPTFYKHLNFLKQAGFKIKRKKDSYLIMNYKDSLQIEKPECQALALLLALSHTSFSEKKIDEFSNIVEKILYLSNKKAYDEVIKEYKSIKNKFFDNIYGKKLKLIQKYIDEKKILKITLSNKKELILEPLGFDYGLKKIYVNFLDFKLRENLKIPIEKIDKISVTVPIYHSLKSPKRETIFELYGNLKSSYILKEDEKIIEKTKDKLVISNSSSDKRVLFQRLLRYDILCKVTFPMSDVADYKKMIEDSISNIK